jgi:hypothetical protein
LIPVSTIFDTITQVKIFYQWYLRVRYNYANPSQRVVSKFLIGEFESASMYAYAQHEALITIDTSETNEKIYL